MKHAYPGMDIQERGHDAAAAHRETVETIELKSYIQEAQSRSGNEGSAIVPLHSDQNAASNSRDDARKTKTPSIIFAVDDIPPWYIILVTAFQQASSCIGGPLATVFIIYSNLCSQGNDVLFAELLGTAIFMCGVCTFLQVTLGVRLPVIQGSSTTFVVPIVAMMSLPQWQCPHGNNNETMITNTNHSQGEPWRIRLLHISGSLTVASLTQVFLGCTGAIGLLMNYIGPLTLIPTVSLVGLSLFPVVTSVCEEHWGIAALTVGLSLLFSQPPLAKVQVPLPTYNTSKGWYSVHYPIFRMFPHVFAVGTAWIVCYVLTRAKIFPDDPNMVGYKARTDAKLHVIEQTKWFVFPYPGRWGIPTLGAGAFVGMLAATLASIMESVGDYYATARICGLPMPPKHAVNRGVAMEGLGSVISGLVGAAHATTTYSSTIGFLAMTGIVSRVVYIATSILLIGCGAVGKFGAALSIVPTPVIGGMLLIGLGMVAAVGLLNIKYLDMKSSRNMVILGTSLLLGMMTPFWIKAHPNAIKTGSPEVDTILQVVLGAGMLVGGIVGFILDNLIPGTREDRGITGMMCDKGIGSTDMGQTGDSKTDLSKLYDLPYVTERLKRIKMFTYLPFMPSFEDRPIREIARCHARRDIGCSRKTDTNMP